MLRGDKNRIRWACVIAFALLFGCAVILGRKDPNQERIVGAWQSVIEPKTEFRFFPDQRMEVRNLFRDTHHVGSWEKLDGEIYIDSNNQYWGPLNPDKPKDLYMIQNFQLMPTGGVAYSYRTINNGRPRWYSVEVRVFEDKAYFSDYDAWMEMKRGTSNPFVRTLENVSTSVANVFGYKH